MYSLPSGPSFNSVSLPLSSLYLYPNVSEPPTFPFVSNVAVCSGASGCFGAPGAGCGATEVVPGVGVAGLLVLGCACFGFSTLTSTVVPFNVSVSPNLTCVEFPFPSFTVIYCLAT